MFFLITLHFQVYIELAPKKKKPSQNFLVGLSEDISAFERTVELMKTKAFSLALSLPQDVPVDSKLMDLISRLDY